ncbi:MULTISPECIES: Crp/Fnr family transcriptional regulator [Listeria]|uniref:Crp/Fnr family transcriptional regulator n=2 Tax=Listeriaceae TaxID=186820 RepID=UPI000B596D38|nr:MULTISPECIES: Crp/Fnr family transcriptional regulator [Listeria]
MMEDLIELYSKKVVEERFNEKELLKLLENQFAIYGENIKISNGRKIVLKEREEYVYYIVHGAASVSKDDTIYCFQGKDRFLGLESMFFDSHMDLDFHAVGNTELIKFKKKQVIDALMNTQEGWIFGYQIAHRFNEVIINHCIFYKLKARSRSKKFLLELADELHEENDTKDFLPKQLNYKMLSEYLGISYVTIRKLFSELRKEGFIGRCQESQRFYINAEA